MKKGGIFLGVSPGGSVHERIVGHFGVFISLYESLG